MTAEQFSQFKDEALKDLTLMNESCRATFRLTSWQRYDYDLESGTLIFSEDAVPRVIASILVAGSTSKSPGTWLWSWANGFIPDNVSEPVKKVRDFGIAENLLELQEPYLPDDEEVGWAMTAVAVRIMGAKGAYRSPGENGFLYLILNDIAFTV